MIPLVWLLCLQVGAGKGFDSFLVLLLLFFVCLFYRYLLDCQGSALCQSILEWQTVEKTSKELVYFVDLGKFQ